MVFLWIATYGLVYLLASCLPRAAHPWVVPLTMTGYAAALIGWIFHTGRSRSLGLCSIRRKSAYPKVLLLMMLPVCNLLTAKTFSPDLPAVLFMLSVCAVEEIFFRGFLLRFLMQFGTLPAIVLSSGIFAAFHLVNLIGGSGCAYVWMQVLCAFTAGICYGAVAMEQESLLPCFLAHFLTNITAAPVSAGAVPWFWLCIIAYGCFGIYLCRKFAGSTSRRIDYETVH